VPARCAVLAEVMLAIESRAPVAWVRVHAGDRCDCACVNGVCAVWRRVCA
jgi:hypothetical protein